MKKYISPTSKIIELAPISMLALSANNETGDGWQLSNKQENIGWDANEWENDIDNDEE